MAEMSEAIAKLLKAIAEKSPKDQITSAAREALRDIRQQRAELQKDLENIQWLASRFGGVSMAELAAEDDTGLSEAQKAVINTLLDAKLPASPDIQAPAMVELIRTEAGIELTDLVSNPAAVVGSMIFQARKRLGLEKPAPQAAAQPAPVPGTPPAQPQPATPVAA